MWPTRYLSRHNFSMPHSVGSVFLGEPEIRHAIALPRMFAINEVVMPAVIRIAASRTAIRLPAMDEMSIDAVADSRDEVAGDERKPIGQSYAPGSDPSGARPSMNVSWHPRCRALGWIKRGQQAPTQTRWRRQSS
jgi:hypothetical protein